MQKHGPRFSRPACRTRSATAPTGETRTFRADDLSRALKSAAVPSHARLLQSFFKTGPGQYAEGDIFLGIRVPTIRKLVSPFRGMAPEEAAWLVRSPVHEERFAGLLLWLHSFEKGDEIVRTRVFALYLRHTCYINNWDLVDLTAPKIVGLSVPSTQTAQLERLAESKLLWERRIAVLATFAYIRHNEFEPSLRLCEKLMHDPHDLMHKACGWMLREVGKRARPVLSAFLKAHSKQMPRTMLRYALEHYPKIERRKYMARNASARPPCRTTGHAGGPTTAPYRPWRGRAVCPHTTVLPTNTPRRGEDTLPQRIRQAATSLRSISLRPFDSSCFEA